jgi:hypothetical protein
MPATIILPQQRLLLELLVMSGEIAVVADKAGALLTRTLKECQAKGWTLSLPVSAGIFRVNITDLGRRALAAAPPLK